jgi:hypothetical protein
LYKGEKSMTREDIIRMAREAGGFDVTPEFLAKFANLVASAEREACANVCDEFPDVGYIDKKLTSDYHAYLIRQRGIV